MNRLLIVLLFVLAAVVSVQTFSIIEMQSNMGRLRDEVNCAHQMNNAQNILIGVMLTNLAPEREPDLSACLKLKLMQETKE